MKYIIEFDDFLNESKELDIANKYKSVIPDNMFIILSKIDVTPTRKYLDKICKFFIQNKKVHNNEIISLDLIKRTIYDFNRLVDKKIIKGKDSDINGYNDIYQLQHKIHIYSNIENEILEKKLKKANIIKIKDNKDLFICVPLDEEASKIYGSNTKWCISAKIGNMYNSYFSYRRKNGDDKDDNKRSDYFRSLLGKKKDDAQFVAFVINKKLESSNPLHKMAIQFNSSNNYNILDSLDMTTYDECIKEAKKLKIELPQEYHDIMKKNHDYEDYINGHLNISKLYSDAIKEYLPKEKEDINKYKNYLEFITLSNNKLSIESMAAIIGKFKSSDFIPDELYPLYDILDEYYNNDGGDFKYDVPELELIYDYYNAINNFCKKHNLKNSIDNFTFTQIIINKENIDYLSAINNAISDINVNVVVVDDLGEFERFDKMNNNNKFKTYSIFFNTKTKNNDDRVKLQNKYDNYYLIKNQNSELQDDIKKSLENKYDIKQKIEIKSLW